MIGPSSVVNDVKNHDENPVRIKRKIFEELDIDSYCDEVCQNSKKCNLMESHILNIDSDDIELSLSSPLIQDTTNNESVTRLEVLVVDGTWDVSNISGADFIDFLPTLNHESGITIGHNNIDNIDNNYGTILSYWEPEIQETSDCSNFIDNHELSSSELLQPSQQQQQQQEQQQEQQRQQRLSSVVNYNETQQINQQDDQENANLSWLIDFKLDSLIEAPEDKTILPCTRINNNVNKNRNLATTINQNDNRKLYNIENNEQINQKQSQITTSYVTPIDNRNYSSIRSDGPKKPPFTYTELIEQALHEKGELTVSAIYQWVSEHFPYYKSNDDRWKNSVRHNLSINPHFRKGSKAPHGAGHLWAIANREDMRPRQLTAMQNYISNTTTKQIIKNSVETNYTRKNNSTDNTRQCIVMDEVAAATASISQSIEEDILSSSTTTLEHSAEQILNGIKKEVEVQYLLPMTIQNNSNNDQQIQSNEQNCIEKATERDCWNVLADFLNPVSKEVVAEECGLIGEGYLVTDLNQSTFGLNMTESEIITSDNLFGEELSFQFYELSSSSQIQSA